MTSRFFKLTISLAVLIALLYYNDVYTKNNCNEYLKENPSEAYRLKCDKIGGQP